MLWMLRTLFVSIVALAGAAWAQDVTGSKDHPIITRYPDSTIKWYLVENFRAYRVPIGPVTGYRKIDKWLDTEGRLTRIYYTLDGGARSEQEVFRNYRDALARGGFEILGEGFEASGGRGVDIGTRRWREVLFQANAWTDASGAVNEMARGSATSGGGGTVVARITRAAGTAYVLVTVYRFRNDRVSTLVDVIEVEQAKTGLIVVDAEAIGKAIADKGRVVLDGILFDFDKASLKNESAQALKNIAAYLRSQPDRRFHVVGHTDSKGAFDYNQRLSAERARAVVDALVKDHAIAAERLRSHGVGPLSPAEANASEPGRERNRRVELVEQ